MDKEKFVENIKFYCKRNNIKPTNACRDSGVGPSFISNIESRGQTPSVEKVQMLAQYLGVTTSVLLGEEQLRPVSRSDALMLRDPNSPRNHPPDYCYVSKSEYALIRAYKNAPPEVQRAVGDMLKRYGEKTAQNAV